jgi:inorganic phosphate transporter, PiT family
MKFFIKIVISVILLLTSFFTPPTARAQTRPLNPAPNERTAPAADTVKKADTASVATAPVTTDAPAETPTVTAQVENEGGLFGLSTGMAFLLVVCLLLVCAFEFVNGFHDTANAVANVIYTNTYKPQTAVFLAGFMNFAGVVFSSIWGYKVAMKIIGLLPIEILTTQNISLSLSMVFALLLTAIIWNLGTWYFGLPASSSHTLVGSILGVVMAYTYVTDTEFTNWGKIQELFLALLFSPLFGFLIAILLMLLLRFIVKSPSKKRLNADVEKGSEEDEWSGESNIFKAPKDGKEPPAWIRYAMMVGSPALAFTHGMNDGQKGIGLMMLVLIGVAPGYFAIDASRNPTDILPNVKATTELLAQVDSTKLSTKMQEKYGKTKHFLADLQTQLTSIKTIDDVPREKRFEIRKNIILAEKNIGKMIESGDLTIDDTAQKSLGKEAAKMKVLTDYAPIWVLILISLSLGVGTTVGWRRVVVTIGEKIGKNSLSYAQGFTADFMAAITVGLSTYFGLPVSTTHVLSSSVAGGFVAQRGIKNLNKGTLRNIMLAWVLTLPVTIILAAGLYLLFRAML